MGAEANTGAVVDAAAGSANVDGTEVDVTSTDGTDGKDPKAAAKDGSEDGLKKALNAERLRANQAEKKLRDAELAKLPELERFKTENETLTKENEKLDLENKKMKIALDLGMSWRLAKRISGDTEEEMRADAADILKDLRSDDDDEDPKDKKRPRPANDARKSGGGSSTPVDMNRLLRAAAGKGK